jgi:transposase
VTAARNRAGFRDQVQTVVEGDPVLEVVAASFIVAHEVVCSECAAIEDELVALARESALARRLMTVPGVGPIVALSFIATIDAAARFAKSTQVGAYLGLTPRRYQSGEVDHSGRISKCGDAAMRALLVEAASSLITRVKRLSPLKAWAVRLAARMHATLSLPGCRRLFLVSCARSMQVRSKSEDFIQRKLLQPTHASPSLSKHFFNSLSHNWQSQHYS